MLDHKQVMFDAIRLMDKQGDRYISEAQLALSVHRHLATLDKVEQQRLMLAFATDNMLQNHILADKDSHDGATRLIFQEAVIGLFRLCESSLYQELTDSKLKTRLAGLWRVQKRFAEHNLSYSDYDPDYTELIDDTFEQLSMLLDVLKRNVVRMRRLSQDFEQMSTDACKDPQVFVEFREQLLEKVTTLFERHIKPTQKFVNHQIKLQDGSNLFETLDDIRGCLEQHDQHAHADQVFRFSVSFTSVIKPISQIARQVDQFLRKTRTSMGQFNAMEYHYQQLVAVYDETLERNLNKTKLNDTYAKSFDFINGLKKLPRPKDFRFRDTPSYYGNMFAEIALRVSDKSPENDERVVLQAWRNEQHERKLQRQLALRQYIQSMSLRPTKDLTAVLHYRLLTEFEDYHFTDLMSGLLQLHSIIIDQSLVLHTSNHRSFINHDGQVYIYRRKMLVSKN